MFESEEAKFVLLSSYFMLEKLATIPRDETFCRDNIAVDLKTRCMIYNESSNWSE